MARREAFGVYHFAVEIDGIQSAYFRSCSGLSSEAEVVPVQEGGLNTTEHKLMGRTKFSDIVLKQGFATGDLWAKRQSFLNDDPGTPLVRFNGTVIQFGPGGKRAHSWQFTNAWICSWEGPEFDASKNEISIETIKIAHEGLIYKGRRLIMAESPKSAAPVAAAAAAPAYTPSGAAASERMLSSVIGRVVGPFGTPIGRSLHFADRLVGGIVDGAGPVAGARRRSGCMPSR